MRLLALGPLEIEGSSLRTLSAAKHRALLAMLFINANRVVSLDALVDGLWDTPPVTATNLVRQYVSHLRKALVGQGEAAVALRTHGGGYTLVVPSLSSDVAEFEELVNAGRTQLAAGQPQETCETVTGALGLWRGEAFADVPPGPAVTEERARLEELRAGALELRTQALVKAGKYTEAISELTSLTSRYPLREGLHANLMRALAATGRKGDALEVYRSARKTLIAELGLEPSEELRTVEHAILADEHDAPGEPAADPAGVTEPVGAAQLPTGLTDFVGRQQLIDQLDQHLTCSQLTGQPYRFAPLAVLSGPAGVGKTSLAVRLGHDLQPAFPDGQIFLRLGYHDGEPLSPTAALGRAIEILGCPRTEQPQGFLARQDLYRRLLAGRRTLMILDDAVDEAQVRPLLPGHGECAVLVTSRSRLAALDGAKHLPVEPFSFDEALRLLSLVAGQERVGSELDAAAAIIDACGGLPLAIRAAAARADNQPHRPLWHLAERLLGADVFAELDVGDLNVRGSVAAAYRALEPAERRVLAGLPTPTGPRAAPLTSDTLTERELRASARSVDLLVAAGALELASVDSDGQLRFRCATLLRRYAQDRVRTDRIVLADIPTIDLARTA